MLYITTRSDKNAFNEKQVLTCDTAPDGGCFVPFCFPKFEKDEIRILCGKTYGEIIAEILNKFFSAQLTGWDVDLCIGRNTARITSVAGKIYFAEMWHNPNGTLTFATNNLYQRIAGTDSKNKPTQWFEIAIHIAYYFALYSELKRNGACAAGSTIDISVNDTNMIAPVAACYARDMGLPIRIIIVTSSNSSVIWELVHRGESNVSACDLALIQGVERLIHRKLGYSAVSQYNSAISKKRTFFIDEEMISAFSEELFCSVLGANRSQQIINSFYRSNSYMLEPNSALCVSGLQNYRAKTGENNNTIILSCTKPASPDTIGSISD